MKISMLSKL